MFVGVIAVVLTGALVFAPAAQAGPPVRELHCVNDSESTHRNCRAMAWIPGRSGQRFLLPERAASPFHMWVGLFSGRGFFTSTTEGGCARHGIYLPRIKVRVRTCPRVRVQIRNRSKRGRRFVVTTSGPMGQQPGPQDEPSD